MESLWRFKVRAPFTARLIGADLPPGQTVIAAVEHEPDVTIEVDELLVSTVEPRHEAGTQTTFARISVEDNRLYRADAETFSSSVDELTD